MTTFPPVQRRAAHRQTLRKEARRLPSAGAGIHPARTDGEAQPLCAAGKPASLPRVLGWWANRSPYRTVTRALGSHPSSIILHATDSTLWHRTIMEKRRSLSDQAVAVRVPSVIGGPGSDFMSALNRAGKNGAPPLTQ
jgi:hypothetical protein